MAAKYSSSGKNRSAGIAEQAVSSVLELFGGNAASLSFAGPPYIAEGFAQRKIGGDDTGLGNCAPRAELFASARELFSGAAPTATLSEEALEKRYFSLACGSADRISTAVQVIFALIQRRGVRKFIIAVKNVSEREAIRHSLPALASYFANVYGCAVPGITVYDSEDRESVRRFACASGGNILLINRESFNREDNLFRKPYAAFGNTTPLSLLEPGHPVLIVSSRDSSELVHFTEYFPLFSPLCALLFLANPDEKGITVPIFRPGSRAELPPPEDDPMQLRFT